MARKIAIVVIILAAIGAAVFFVLRRQQVAQEQAGFEIVREATIARGRITSTVNATGTIEPEALVSLSFGTAGVVQAVGVQRGQAVRAGDVLATLDTTELQLAVQQARDALRIQELTLAQRSSAEPSPATLAAAQADIDSAAGNVQIVQANLAAARADVRSAEGNLTIVRANADAAEADVRSAEANLTLAQAGTQNTQTDIASAQANLAAVQAQAQAAQASATSAQANVTAAQANLSAAQAAKSQLQAGATGAELAAVQADIAAADANVRQLQNAYDQITRAGIGGPQEEQGRLALNVARKQLEAAQARLTALNAGPRQADLQAADAQIAAAQANIAIAQANLQGAQAQAEAAQANVAVAQVGVTRAQNAAANVTANIAAAEATLARARAAARAATGNIAIAQANVERAQASVAAVQGNLAIAEANLARARAAYDRLLEKPTAEELAILEAQVESARTGLQTAEQRLAQARIASPIDGVVARVVIGSGEQVSPGAAVITILNEAAYHLEVNVDEIDIEQVALNQPVDVTLDALPNVAMRGLVADIAPTAGGSAGGVVTYLVTINIVDDAGVDLRAGLTANASVIVQEIDDVLLAPNWAVRLNRETGAAFVNLLSGPDAVREVTIETGLRNEQFSQVLAGLSEGDTVVITNAREGFTLFGFGGN